MILAIKRIIPKPIRSKLRRYFPYITGHLNATVKWFSHILPDVLERVTGKRDALTPPKRINFVGDGDFKEIGREFFGYFLQLGNLRPDEKVLEVGCGLGRMAVPLMVYLDKKKGGSYDGFDIVARGIKWCRRKITPRAWHFRFQHADVFNYGYNPLGKNKAEDYRFPYEDQTFDFVFLTSVFTHMLETDLIHYIQEINRVLKPGGRCFCTYFLLNGESQDLIEAGKSTIDFSHIMAGFPQNRIKDTNIPEAAVAYPESHIKELYRQNNLGNVQTIRYGSWCGRSEFLSYQDIIVAQKV